jgi:hypothetical protein
MWTSDIIQMAALCRGTQTAPTAIISQWHIRCKQGKCYLLLYIVTQWKMANEQDKVQSSTCYAKKNLKMYNIITAYLLKMLLN